MRVYAIYFSPTSGTEAIVKRIADTFGEYETVDLTNKKQPNEYGFCEEDICVIGVPSYGGRVPSIALERMRTFIGNKAKAILVVAYGNRAYEDTLKELQEYVVAKNFDCVAAIAAIAEHSIMHQFACGRPDEQDTQNLIALSKQILHKIQNVKAYESLRLPGNYPYRSYDGVPLKPRVNKRCTNCGTCASLCPVEAIPQSDPSTTNKDVCISCMRCVKLCPNQARTINKMVLQIASLGMKKSCSNRKENELFL